ncbi:3-keto-disaccharide hydrolase [Flectobacillus longus]|jgi:hypothetical protein|uniref:3-keto-disaccharide hydrolase n=1 Tax=Flectobacillus longus TaxID=2984207 RepID=UPI0024B6EF09|nr:DUF1080 domain-containing protein [Flectobacillus longus]MDI9879814.1 DUF1080 domain-containing protein [Flectobacillus longus]
MVTKLKCTFVFFLLLTTSLISHAQSKLFNGKNLKGWYAYEPKTGKHTNASDIFYVENKMIRLYGDKLGYVMTEKSFSNFQLTVVFRWNTDSTITRKSNKRNSGIMYLVPTSTKDTLWPKGIQYQVKEGGTGDFVLLQEVTLMVKGKQTEPGKSVTSARFSDAEKPVGEWNTAVITVMNGNVKQELNGKLVNEGTLTETGEGRILLQYEGYPIDFSKIVIKKI